MSTMPVTWYVAKCDQCGRTYGDADYELDDEYGPHRATRAEAQKAAIDDGWRLYGTHYQPYLLNCPDCSKCAVCERSPAHHHDGRSRCADHPHRHDDNQMHLTIDTGGERTRVTAVFLPATLDDPTTETLIPIDSANSSGFITRQGPVRIADQPGQHDIYWTCDMGALGYVVQCRCTQQFNGDDEAAAHEEHAAHVERTTRHAAQDPILHHAQNPHLPAQTKGHKLDLIEIDEQPAHQPPWWKRLRWLTGRP